jgi:polysaccharide export outer membrane protein
MIRVRTHLLLLCAIAVAIGAVRAIAQAPDRLRAQDSLIITVVDQPTLSKKYMIESDGRITVPLLGRVQASGFTTEQLGNDLQRRLAEFFAKPVVHVEVERSKRVFVFGGVNAPGMYPLTTDMTIVELLSRAGYTGASEAMIVRPRNPQAPALPDDKDTTVIHVNLREFEKDLEAGRLGRNVVLQDGDTIYVPRFDPNRIFVSGQVRTPGAYSVPENTTLLQALALAGGPTERAALGRVRVLRLQKGKQTTVKARLEDLVRPGDTIIVPERYF